MNRGGMGSHHSATMGKDEWLTPPEIVQALGLFDLDPCSPIVRPWPTAKTHFTIEDDGLSRNWTGRVWLNPPYGDATGDWLERLASHGNGIALIFARTETTCWFAHVWSKADAILFLRGRLSFYHVSGKQADKNAGAPSALVAYGKDNAERLLESRISGRFIRLDIDHVATPQIQLNLTPVTE